MKEQKLDSGEPPKSVHDEPESVFTLLRNECSRWAEISVHVAPKYAVVQTFVEFPGEFVIDLPELLIDFIAHYDRHELPQFIE